MVSKIKKQNEQADDLMEQQDDMIANHKVCGLCATRCARCALSVVRRLRF